MDLLTIYGLLVLIIGYFDSISSFSISISVLYEMWNNQVDILEKVMKKVNYSDTGLIIYLILAIPILNRSVTGYFEIVDSYHYLIS